MEVSNCIAFEGISLIVVIRSYVSRTVTAEPSSAIAALSFTR